MTSTHPDSTSGVRRISGRLIAAVPGAYAVATLLHLAFMAWLPDPGAVLATYSYSLYPVMAALFIWPFFIRKIWKCFAIYLGLILVLAAAVWAAAKFRLPA